MSMSDTEQFCDRFRELDELIDPASWKAKPWEYTDPHPHRPREVRLAEMSAWMRERQARVRRDRWRPV